MRKFYQVALVSLLILGSASCDSGLSCDEASSAIDEATQNYTSALDNGGDGAAECLALQEALQTLLDDADCPDETHDMARSLLTSLNCD
jgi:hypothetical protein